MQEIFPAAGYDLAEVVLPAAAFTEETGTITTERGPMPIRKVIKAPDLALEDWKIVAKIAQELDLSGFKYLETFEIHQEMEKTGVKMQKRPVDKYYLKYRGTAIADKVPDFKILLEYREGKETPW